MSGVTLFYLQCSITMVNEGVSRVCKLSSALKLTHNLLTAAVGGSLMWNINVGLTFLGSFLMTETGGNKPPTTCCILG